MLFINYIIWKTVKRVGELRWQRMNQKEAWSSLGFLMCILFPGTASGISDILLNFSLEQHSHIRTGWSSRFTWSKSKKEAIWFQNACVHSYSFHSCRSTASYFASSWKTTMGFTTGRWQITSLQVLNIFLVLTLLNLPFCTSHAHLNLLFYINTDVNPALKGS